jgi:hypothetical protein
VGSWRLCPAPSEPALCSNPMTVAVQHDAITDSIKYRPCIDLSHFVNAMISKSSIKLDDLSLAQELIQRESITLPSRLPHLSPVLFLFLFCPFTVHFRSKNSSTRSLHQNGLNISEI